MCKKALTLDNLTQSAGADCGCGPDCGDATSAPVKPLALIKETTMEVVGTVKETTEAAVAKAKIKMRNEKYQKAALVVVGLGALYVIFK